MNKYVDTKAIEKPAYVCGYAEDAVYFKTEADEYYVLLLSANETPLMYDIGDVEDTADLLPLPGGGLFV